MQIPATPRSGRHVLPRNVQQDLWSPALIHVLPLSSPRVIAGGRQPEAEITPLVWPQPCWLPCTAQDTAPNSPRSRNPSQVIKRNVQPQLSKVGSYKRLKQCEQTRLNTPPLRRSLRRMQEQGCNIPAAQPPVQLQGTQNQQHYHKHRLAAGAAGWQRLCHHSRVFHQL